VSDHVDFLLLGLGNGAVYAALAVAIVVVYRASGVLNFATGAMALQGAQTYVFLRQGTLLVLVPALPATVGVGGPWGFWPALALTMALEALVGVLLYFAVFRPLRRRGPMAKAVASLGMMVVISGLVAQRAVDGPALAGAIFPTGRVDIAGSFVTTDRLYLALTILGLAVALAGVDRFTRFGLQTRAVSESEVGALVSGLSPDRIGAANWALSGAIVALAGVLISPLTPLNASTYTLFVVPAMAAAVIGRFTRMVPAAIAGLAIGMLQSEAVLLQSRYDWMPDRGAGELVPLAMVLIFLVARSPRIPERGSLPVVFTDAVRAPRSVSVPTVGLVVAAFAAIFVLDGSHRSALYTTFIMAMFGLSLVVVTGFLGQISLAQLSIGGVAGFLMATFTTDWGLPFPIAPLLAALCATVVGVVIGLPALRVRGLFVAVVTLMLAVALEAVWFRNPQFAGGIDGNTVEAPSLFGLDLGIGSGADFPRREFGVLCLLALAATALSVVRLRTSRLGYNLLAVRANERSAAASGVDVVRTKLAGFAISAFIAGLAGALLAYKNTSVSFESYNVLSGLLLFAVTYVSGIASIAGGLIAGALAIGGIVYVIIDRSVELGLWYNVTTGMALILVTVLQPQGIAGSLRQAASRIGDRVGRRTRPATQPAIDRAAPEPREEPPTGSPTPPPMSDDIVLSVSDLSVWYSGVAALTHVGLEVQRGSIVGLIGPNGAGKTTLLDAVCGLTPATGDLVLDGVPLTGPPHRRARQGMARTFQGLDLYEQLTVHENVVIGQNLGADHRHDDRHVRSLLDELGLGPLTDQLVAELSQGQRQLVSIARSLAGQPGLLLLDEPAAGLDTAESSWLGTHLETVRRRGVTVLLIEHDMALVSAACDVVHVLDFGRIIARGTPAELHASPEVAAAYLGTPETAAPAW
jgi:ABC-type branched-subunit amino acid transport system ATPase component/ABC-type branched-subunit amino acid transport system permease subunit